MLHIEKWWTDEVGCKILIPFVFSVLADEKYLQLSWPITEERLGFVLTVRFLVCDPKMATEHVWSFPSYWPTKMIVYSEKWRPFWKTTLHIEKWGYTRLRKHWLLSYFLFWPMKSTYPLSFCHWPNTQSKNLHTSLAKLLLSLEQLFPEFQVFSFSTLILYFTNLYSF